MSAIVRLTVDLVVAQRLGSEAPRGGQFSIRILAFRLLLHTTILLHFLRNSVFRPL